MSPRADKNNGKSCKKNKQTTSSVCSHEAPAPATTKEGEPKPQRNRRNRLIRRFFGSSRVLTHGVTRLSQARMSKDAALQRAISPPERSFRWLRWVHWPERLPVAPPKFRSCIAENDRLFNATSLGET
jgi:hypothetical protein